MVLAGSKQLVSLFELRAPLLVSVLNLICIALFSFLDVSDLPDTITYVTVMIGYFFDFKFKILILLDTFDAQWFFLDSQVIGLGERDIFSDL